MPSVVIADDHTLLRQSVAKAVQMEPDVDLVGEAADGQAALDLVRRHRPDIVLLDISMPGMDGLTVGTTIRRELPDTKLVFLSMHDDDNTLRRAIDLDAAGFVSKSASIEELVEALRAIKDGGSYLSSTVARRVMDIAAGRGSRRGPGLTEREQEILQLLADGARPAEIAQTLFLSVKTVKNHLTSIYQKLGVETGAQAVATAYRHGLVTPNQPRPR